MKDRSKLVGRRDVTKGLVSLGGAIFLGCDVADIPAPDKQTLPGSSQTWATGGTAAMVDKDSYPDPFEAGSLQCLLLAAATEGPCPEAGELDRVDISEGYPGLPMRLAFRVLDTSCRPIANAKVKVWHTQVSGSYSGETPNAQCLKDPADATRHYFRGVQTTDGDGRVFFDSCFPGWYAGRTPHVHYTVSVDGKSFTSQLVFDQAIVDDIFANQADYTRYGKPDTANASDNVVGNADLATYVATAQRMTDGTLLASKELIVFTA